MSDDKDAQLLNPVTQQQVIEEDAGVEPKSQAELEKQQAFVGFEHAKRQKGVNMSVKVYSPTRVYYSGLAFSVTATSATGEFDILPKHHPFISLLDACDVVVRTLDEGNRTISISGGLVHVKSDEVIVFLDI